MRVQRFSLFTIGALFAGLGILQMPIYGQKNAPVVVTNTAANPVPVAGGVTVTNTPTVDARQSGTWNVGLAGTPTVRVEATSPLNVRIADQTAKQWSGFNLVTQEEFYEPPSGKTFVANYISGSVTVPNIMGTPYLLCPPVGYLLPKMSRPLGGTNTTWYFSEAVGEVGWPGNFSCTSNAAVPISFAVIVRGHLVSEQGGSQ